MKKIGEGYFYIVYDKGNGRVLKKSKSGVRLFLYILFSNLFLPRTIREYKNAKNTIPKIVDIYKNILKRLENKSLIGNPVFLDGIDYEQDKVVTLKKVFRKQNEEENKLLLEKYILFIKELWKYGCHEMVFNFTLNHGMDKNGNVIMLDFNEVSFDKSQALKDIQNHIWTKRYSYFHLSSSLREFYKNRMSEELTEENLNSLWEVAK